MHYLKIPTRVVNTYIYIYIILYIYNTCQHLLRDSILRLQDGATYTPVVLLYCFTTSLLYHFTTSLLYYFTILLLYYCTTDEAQRRRNADASLHECSLLALLVQKRVPILTEDRVAQRRRLSYCFTTLLLHYYADASCL
jgi:hypothetical protein